MPATPMARSNQQRTLQPDVWGRLAGPGVGSAAPAGPLLTASFSSPAASGDE